MLLNSLIWIYVINATLLMVHEVEAGYWKEWNLFAKVKNEKKALNGFLIFHLIVIPIVLYGLLELNKASLTGLIISLALALSGIFAFVFHIVMIRKGRKEFNTIFSLSILALALMVSIIQTAVSILLMI